MPVIRRVRTAIMGLRTEPPVAVWHVGLQAKHADAEATIRELREDVQDAQKRAGTLQLDLDAVRTASKQREAQLEAENAELAAQVDTIPQLQEFRKRAEVCGCGFTCVVVCVCACSCGGGCGCGCGCGCCCGCAAVWLV